MLTRGKLLFAVLASATVMLIVVANASARSLNFSEHGLEYLWRELVFNAAGNVIKCPITLLVTWFERTIPKAAGQIGTVNHVTPTNGAAPPCTGGTITILNETLPWRINYVGFTGTLPDITAIRVSLIRVAIGVKGSFGTCLAGTTALRPMFAEILVNGEVGSNRGRVEGVRPDETARIPLGGGFICEIAGESTFSGTGSVLNLPGTAAITIILI